MPPSMPTPRPRARTLREATAASLAIDAATVEALQLLEEAGIAALLLKGPALARLLYDPGEERSWDDADLLVEPSRHARALDLLEAIGFAPRISDPLERGSVPHAVHLVREPRTSGAAAKESLDLHVSFSGVEVEPELLWSSLWSGRERIELFGRPVEVPSVEARLALVALHAATHGSPHLRSLRDLQRAVRRFDEVRWSAAAELAREWRALDYFVVGLRLDPEGSRLLERLGISHDPPTAALMRGAGMPRAQRSFEQFGRTSGVFARLRLIIRKSFPSPELMRTWKPLAGRGRAGLLLAYLWRPAWLLYQLVPGLRSYFEASRR